ncbi:hypothetical protein LCGC14_0200520 [marine sediment metagenome]|uniref:SiaC family regulatory phosphoprotein domain-containing protein n=1 Tax=marine sediment metagenome TaxID=412755 RepID=A0A0F9V086_9ZZZZ|nr:DUF1987 domain-containing protein [Halopseudomonas sabulinigri]|tara:strand:+ start:12093 stop:12470 length:378 start_codon:yes stop_codon:yes gene_type:complete
MTDFSIASSQSTPEVRSDWANGKLYMEGDSYPENSFDMFQQVFVWMESYLEQATAPLTLELRLLYLNTSSVKAMMDIFDLLEAAHQEGKPVSVYWYYDPQNERVAELAEEFKEDCNFPFDIISHT